jgi:cellulose synthase operon protein C
MTLRLLFILALVCGCTHAGESSAREVEWLLKDAFEEEYQPLREVEITTPREVVAALESYGKGDYRKTVATLEKLRQLKLPDGRLDFVNFALAECYRELGCADLAARDYSFVIKTFPWSDKTPPSYYRLLGLAARDDDLDKVEHIYKTFKNLFPQHPLFPSVTYQYAVLFYHRNEFSKAAEALSRIPEQSSIYIQSHFLLALCQLQAGDYDKALVSLEIVRKNAPHGDLADEATILIGDSYFLENNPGAAYDRYLAVPRDAARFHYVLVKIARTLMEVGRLEEAVKTAKNFLANNQKSTYYFEMASVLEQAYSKLGRENDAAEIDKLIHRQIIDARLGFEIYDEIDRVTDMMRSWQEIEYQAIRKGNQPLQKLVGREMDQLESLEKQYYALLKSVTPAGAGSGKVVPFRAERRYMAILKAKMSLYDDTLSLVRNGFEETMKLIAKRPADSALATKADSLSRLIDTLAARRTTQSHEYDLVVKECIGNTAESREVDEDLQAKFVDWAFIKYQEKKEELKKINLALSAQKRASQEVKSDKKNAPRKPQSAKGGRVYTENDRERQERIIVDERSRLSGHIATILEAYPRGKYAPAILLRLAELHFDEAGDEFQARLKAYEKKMAEGKDTAGLEFPDYRLDSVIATYDRIITEFPHSDVTDGALFYKALALQKIGKDEEGNSVLIALINKYPESHYYVEANMNIGKYYFDHPKTEKGQGYKLAEEAYRRVLFFRKHPEYISALYHLGWCYYMQDQYEEAIAVFKYLIEESNLDFDPANTDEKQLANPLLRGEAIDYIAISFDAENKVDDALQFLKLVGNIDYAALVLKRIGELREEDLDVPAAIRIYQRLLSEYPKSKVAPETYVSLIRLYESHNQPDSAMRLREQFFTRYTHGGELRKQPHAKDSAFNKTIDSMAILNGLFVADAAYRKADSTANREEFSQAAAHYERLVKSYPDDPRATEALWNLAVILDTKLQEKPQAFDRYITFSKLTRVEKARREQAALNAIAIAQSLLPSDSTVTKGMVDFAAAKVVEAVENYSTQFPDGASWGKVMLGLGAIYFNRHLFTSAAGIYERIIARGAKNPGYYEAISLLGQCHFGEENWPAAITAFEKVCKESADEAEKTTAKKLLLQAEFLNAKRFFAAGDFANAAVLFKAVDDKYPGSEYGDIVLFNAAEAHEKLNQWEKACDRYYDLVKRYPVSKLAAEALFNAASNFEKINKFEKAADAYEQIVNEYPASDKAKDALFNVGFCYEKLGKPEKMADANERYSARYPGEKDVEAMLLRSAAFYVKASMWDRALSVYRNFIRRYPRNPKSIEAYFMVAKCAYDQGDKVNALLGFNQAEQQNMNLAKDNLETNNYFAAEAAYYTGLIQRDKFLAIKLTLPEDQLKRSLKEKSDLLAEAAKAFQRVMQYRSERMFEAAYRVGQLYEDLAAAWKDQERPSLDPIKEAVLDKDIQSLASGLLQKSFIPYEKAFELAKGFDSLGTEQKSWVEKSKSSLEKDIIDAGDLLKEAVSSMSSAPVPKEIRDKPLHYYQYQKQLLEALLPIRQEVLNYYASSISLCDSLGLKGGHIDSCRSEYARANYAIGEGYDKLSSQILRNAKEVSKDLSQDEREDLLFQLEDIVFELQDKAILAYADGLKRIKQMNLQGSRWAGEIIGNLARLSPEKYGASYFKQIVAVSNGSWIFRSDSVEAWCSSSPPAQGWQRADTVLPLKARGFSSGTPVFIWDAKRALRVYLWKNLFIDGMPRSASIFVATPSMYRFFVNGSLVLSDTTLSRDPAKVDSATGITSMLKGGDNFVAAEIIASDSAHIGIAVLFSAMIDTSEHFSSTMTLPAALKNVKVEYVETAEGAGKKSVSSTEAQPKIGQLTQKDRTADVVAEDYAKKYRNRGELLMAIDNFSKRERQITAEIKKERFEVERMKIERDSVDRLIKRVRNQIDSIKTRIDGMTKGKTSVAPSNATQPAPMEQGDALPMKVVTPASPSASKTQPRDAFPPADTAASVQSKRDSAVIKRVPVSSDSSGTSSRRDRF